MRLRLQIDRLDGRLAGTSEMTARDPFLASVMSRSWLHRLAAIAGVLVVLWAAIAWAVSLP